MYFLLFVVIFISIDLNSAQSFNATAFCTNINGHGYYPYQNSYNCSQYVKCYSYDGTSTLGWVYTCPGTTLFNATASFCQDGYTCIPPPSTTSTSTVSTSTSTTSSTTTVSTTTINPPPFNATAFCSTQTRGYFRYPTGCSKYIYCYTYDTTMLGLVLTCLGTTAFNPAFGYCMDGYKC